MITSKLTVAVHPVRWISNRLHDIPMLSNLSVLDSPEVAAACRNTAEASLRYSKHHMDFIIDYGDALLCH